MSYSLYAVFVFLFFLLLPSFADAAGVGFVPSTRLWLSSDEAVPGNTVSVYTVVINNNYPSLDATVAFYADQEQIGAAQVTALPKETARQVKAAWQPKPGEHALSARFLRATAIDTAGKRTEIDVSDLNTVADLTLRGESPAPANAPPASEAGSQSPAPTPTVSEASTLPNEVVVIVKQEGDKLTIAPRPPASPAQAVDEFIAKNREALAKLEAAKAVVTSTLKQLSDAWEGAKTNVESGKEYYKAGQAWWGKAEPAIEQGKAVWNVVSDNNNPRRLIIIGVGVIILLLILRKVFRRRTY